MEEKKTYEQFADEVKYGFKGNFMEGDIGETEEKFLASSELDGVIRSAYDEGKSFDEAVAAAETAYDKWANGNEF